MDPLSIIDQFATMNDPLEIEESLQGALSLIEKTDDWNFNNMNVKGMVKESKESNQISFLHDQVLRSATRILCAENEIQATRSESSENKKKLMDIESLLVQQKEAQNRILCDRSEEEKEALTAFKNAVAKARLEYENAKNLFAKKRLAKLQLVSAAKERLDMLRVSHEELGRVYAKKVLDLEQKLQKEKMLYTLNLDSLAVAQEEDKGEAGPVEDDVGKDEDEVCSSTSDESECDDSENDDDSGESGL